MGRKNQAAMIVIGLIAIFFSGWSIYRIEKRKREVYTRFGPVITALEQYRNDMGEYTESLDKLAPTYLSEIPDCPSRSHRKAYTTPRGREYSIICPVLIFSLCPRRTVLVPKPGPVLIRSVIC